MHSLSLCVCTCVYMVITILHTVPNDSEKWSIKKCMCNYWCKYLVSSISDCCCCGFPLSTGNALITVATGPMNEVMVERTGLVSAHAYAVLTIREVNVK